MSENKSQTFERSSLLLFSFMAVGIGVTLIILTLADIGSGGSFWISLILGLSVALFGIIHIYKIKKER